MKAVLVYHVKDTQAPNGRGLLSEIGWGDLPIDYERNHDLVAHVEVHSVGMKALDEAYKLTQNINDSWTKNAFVSTVLEGCRSTHIGDVLVMDMDAYVCAPVGWTKIEAADQKVVRG